MASPPNHLRRKRSGFTLIEIVVVIGIIVLLAALLVPAIGRSYREAGRARVKADLEIISNGLEAYRLDQRDYPRWTPDVSLRNGAVLLCWALVAPGPAVSPDGTIPGDGNNGPGFRTRGVQGQVYGPYIPMDRFKLIDMSTGNSPDPMKFDNTKTALLDRYSSPIYYCPANPNTSAQQWLLDDPTHPAHPNAGTPVFDYRYLQLGFPQVPLNSNWTIPQDDASRILGDVGDGSPRVAGQTPNPPNGKIDPSEIVGSTGPFILWSAGPDGLFGLKPGKQPWDVVTDDVTNFRN